MLLDGTPDGAGDALCGSPDTKRATGAQLRRDEAGSLIIYGMFCLVTMLLLAGVALDLMRFEERRTVLQATLDRAVLAAADRDQVLDCKSVVKDYFIKAKEAPPEDADILCTKNDFGSEVQVRAETYLPTWFMDTFGVNLMTAPAAGTAEERVGSVEISLVLDVSGSMNSQNRLTFLKPAAKEFIDKMFDSIEPGKLSISIVTYSTQVALGQDFLKYFNHTAEHTKSSCLEFDTTSFTNTSVRPKSTAPGLPPLPADFPAHQLNGHFDPFNSSLVNINSSNTLMNCPPDTQTNRALTAFSGDRAALKAKIDSLVASGNTSIDLGIKWGAALLDPSMQPVLTRMIGEGRVPAVFTGRPYDYYRANGTINTEVLKVIVLMTDGENTTEWKLRSTYRNPANDSTLFMSDTINSSYTGNNWYKRFTLFDAGRSGNKYYSFFHSAWRSEPWGQQPTDISGNDTPPRRLKWPEVWDMMSVNWFADNLIFRVYGSTVRNQWRTNSSNAIATTFVSGTKDANVLGMCDAAKAKSVAIYSIAFMAPPAGQTLLQSCASATANYHYVSDSSGIGTVFNRIANSINKLRLTN